MKNPPFFFIVIRRFCGRFLIHEAPCPLWLCGFFASDSIAQWQRQPLPTSPPTSNWRMSSSCDSRTSLAGSSLRQRTSINSMLRSSMRTQYLRYWTACMKHSQAPKPGYFYDKAKHAFNSHLHVVVFYSFNVDSVSHAILCVSRGELCTGRWSKICAKIWGNMRSKYAKMHVPFSAPQETKRDQEDCFLMVQFLLYKTNRCTKAQKMPKCKQENGLEKTA